MEREISQHHSDLVTDPKATVTDANQSQRHPRSTDICTFFRRALDEVEAGERDSLPTNLAAAAMFDAHRSTIRLVLARADLLDEVRHTRRILTKRHKAVTILASNVSEIHEGEAVTVFSYKEVGEKLGTDKQTVAMAVKKSGYQQVLQEAREKANEVELEQSHELAWFLGMMIGGGRIERSKRNKGTIVFTSSDEYSLLAFKEVGESLFNIPGREKKENEESRNSSIVFHSALYAKALGDFHMRERHTTIQELHEWAIESPFINSFVSGILDSGATITLKPTKRRVDFFTTHPEIGDFYRMILIRLEMEKVRIAKNKDMQRIRGVEIGTMSDLRKFAESVSSVNPTTQQQLEQMKMLKEKKKVKPPIGSIADVIAEWRRLTQHLGHTPTVPDIVSLRAEEETPYAVSIYSRFFGGEGAKFSIAQKNLEAIVLGTEVDPQILLTAKKELLKSDNYKIFLAKKTRYP